jgi:hypothetical protein
MKSLLSIAFLVATTALAAPPATSCTSCHGSDLFDEKARAKTHRFSADVHAQVGLSCHDCHGGNPDPKLADDMAAAMDASFKGNPYVGAPDRRAIPDFCGRCHSSASYMKRFNPAARIDQVSEYWTSHHGQRLKAGDANVATCVDCHSVHDIKRKGDSSAPIYPTHVAETCSRCHSDANRMASYKDDRGDSLPVDQFARWRVSVHAKAMFEKGDLSAPTCNDCHGNHGATPPGIESVSFVCGQCHGREAELFRASHKHELWTGHNNEMLTDGAECGTCHEGERAKLQVSRLNECVTCHENHGVIRPTIAIVGILPDTPCAFCHEGSGPLATRVAEPEKKAAHYKARRDQLLVQAKALGLSGDTRFDWLVDQALQLNTHSLAPSQEGNAKPRLRPEFARLFEKFRIGKTHYTYDDPAGKKVRVAIRRCAHCHDADDTVGNSNARAYVDATRGLTSAIARAERILLSAQRGGVEVRNVSAEVDGAVDAQIEISALVHTFDSNQVQKKQREGLQHAEAALVAGQRALDELSYRRRGLFLALGVIALVLAALALKIRTL